MADIPVYLDVFPALRADFDAIARLMVGLVLRNVASKGWVFQDDSGRSSSPGCIIASPSFVSNDSNTDQDYVYNWTRDSAITAVELSAAGLVSNLRDYVAFAALAQSAALANHLSISRGAFHIDGQPRNWTDQSDGPALQTLALLGAWPQLGPATATALGVIAKNIEYLLAEYRGATTNLWEETSGHSFFARSVQLKCFTQVLSQATTLGLSADLQSRIEGARADLSAALGSHWDAGNSRYASILGAAAGARGSALNVDVVMASVYGAVPPTDTKLLASAAQVRDAFANQSSTNFYAINAQDARRVSA